MMDRVVSRRAAAKVATRAALFAALLSCTIQSHAATAGARTKAGVQAHADMTRDFAALAKDRAKKCPDDKAPGPAVRGWRSGAMQCAWQNRLQMRRWASA